MRTSILKGVVFAACGLLSASPGIAMKAPAAAGEEMTWNFRVLLDDRPIGYHRVTVNREAERKSVHTRANFDVRFLLIPVYSYEHETRETWRNGCVVGIQSQTDDNGDEYFIRSEQREQALALETQDGSASLDGCVRTFAYWDVEMLQSEYLLNTQTGEYLPVAVTDLGTGTLALEQGDIEARHFRLVAGELTIDLWYTAEMHWLALESQTESGALLRYLPAGPEMKSGDKPS